MSELPEGVVRLNPVAEKVFGFGRRHAVARTPIRTGKGSFLLSESDKQRVLAAIQGG